MEEDLREATQNINPAIIEYYCTLMKPVLNFYQLTK